MRVRRFISAILEKIARYVDYLDEVGKTNRTSWSGPSKDNESYGGY